MTLARDEKVGLLIAALVGGLALASYAYRSTRSSAPAASKSEPVHVVENERSGSAGPRSAAEGRRGESIDQAARDAYAEVLAQAFADDGSAAGVRADGTVLAIRWEMCSKQMLHRLLHDDQNFQVKNVRAAAELTPVRLRSHGFTKVVCDDGRKGLTPASTTL